MLLISGLFHVVVWLANGAPSLQGPVTWRKPIEFGLSGGITALSLAWVIGRLPRSKVFDWASSIGVAFFVPEAALVDLQQWRGVPSHFNRATAFDEAIFTAMGIIIAVVVLAIFVLAVRCIGPIRATPATALAIRAGMVFLVLGQFAGGLIVMNEVPGDVARASVFGAAGELKVPHAIALHGLQVLAILALALERTRLSERARTLSVVGAALGYGLVLAAGALQTFSGRSPLDVSALTLTVGVAGAVLVGLAYFRAFLELRRSSLA